MNNWLSDSLVHAWGSAVSLVAVGFSFIFDVPAAWVFAAFAGAYAGVFFGEPVSRKMSIGLVLAGTVTGGWGVSIILHNPHLINLEAGNYSARAIAATIGFVGIHFRSQLQEILTSILEWRFGIVVKSKEPK